jgi:hypothetical protein
MFSGPEYGLTFREKTTHLFIKVKEVSITIPLVYA